jgi:LysM repeat protein
MIIDQLFEDDKKKKLNEVDPRNFDSDEDYYAALYAPAKRRSASSDYPYSQEQDDDYFREIFRKKRLAVQKAEREADHDRIATGTNESKYNKKRQLNEDLLLEYTVFQQSRQFGQLLVEYNLTKAQVQQLFKDVEQGATAAGNNRTGLGKAKDVTTKAIGSVQNMLASARKWVKERPTYQAVDTEYNRAMSALGKAGGENGEANAITKAIYKYRDAAKNYPRAAGLAKWAIITAAGLATGGVGGAGVAAGLAAIDSALKDKEIVDIVGDAASAALVSGAVQGASELGGMAKDAYYGIPSGSEIAANNAALGNWNDTDVPGGAASNINGLDLPPDAAADAGSAAAGEATPEIVGPGVEALSPEELANAAAQAKAYGFDGDVTLDQLNQAIMQTAEPGTVPADYSQLGASGGTTDYTVVDGDTLSKIAAKNGVSVKELADANGIDYKDVDNIKAGQTLKIPGETGSSVYDQGVGAGGRGSGMSSADANNFRADNLARMQNQADVEYYQNKPDDFGINPRSNDAVGSGMPGSAAGQIDYSKPGPMSTDSMGGKLEYGVPVNDKGSFIPPNPNLPAEELAKQQAAYDTWKADFTKRWPSATQLPDGSMRAGNPIGMTPKFESIKLKVLPNDLLIDSKFTVLSWALNESTNREMGRSLQLTKLGVRTVFENIGRYRRAYLKEYTGAPTAAYGHPTAAGAPADATAGQSKQGWFGKTLDTIGRGVDKVGKWASNAGHNVITKVTADKLNNMWTRAGDPYDSNQLYKLLTTEWGVPQEVVDSVFSKMGIPYTTGVAGTPAPQASGRVGSLTGINKRGANRPYNGDELYAMQTKNMAADELRAGLPNMANQGDIADTDKLRATANAELGGKPTTATTTTAAQPTQSGKPGAYNASNVMNLPGMQKYAKPGTTAPAKTPNFAQQGSGYAKINQPTAISYGSKPVTKPAGTRVTAGGPTAAEKAALDKRIAAAAQAQPVAETVRQVNRMMETVTTKADVQRIKDYIDYHMGTNLTESAQLKRNRLLSEVTQLAATRRREIARRLA